MGNRKRTTRDRRRRTLGQNFLVRPRHIEEFLASADLTDDDHVVELGAGIGALTVPLARCAGRVTAVERDPVWAKQLRDRLRADGLAGRVQVLCVDLRGYRLPAQPYRVMANPPFGLTTALLGKLLDDPAAARCAPTCSCNGRLRSSAHSSRPPPCCRPAGRRGGPSSSGPSCPEKRSDLSHASTQHGSRSSSTSGLHASATRSPLRKRPRLANRRDQPVLPTWLAASLPRVLRPVWEPPAGG